MVASDVACRADISASTSAPMKEPSATRPYLFTMPLAVCQLPPVEIADDVPPVI